MSDIALVASVDFTGAEAEVNRFVTNTKRKLATILADARRAGGSLSGGFGGRVGQAGAAPAGSTGTRGAPTSSLTSALRSNALDAYRKEIAKIQELERAFGDGSIKWHNKVLQEKIAGLRRFGALTDGNFRLRWAMEAEDARRTAQATAKQNATAAAAAADATQLLKETSATRQRIDAQTNASIAANTRNARIDAAKQADIEAAYTARAHQESVTKRLQENAAFRAKEKSDRENASRALASVNEATKREISGFTAHVAREQVIRASIAKDEASSGLNALRDSEALKTRAFNDAAKLRREIDAGVAANRKQNLEEVSKANRRSLAFDLAENAAARAKDAQEAAMWRTNAANKAAEAQRDRKAQAAALSADLKAFEATQTATQKALTAAQSKEESRRVEITRRSLKEQRNELIASRRMMVGAAGSAQAGYYTPPALLDVITRNTASTTGQRENLAAFYAKQAADARAREASNALTASRGMMVGAAGNARTGYYTPANLSEVIDRNTVSSTGQRASLIAHYAKQEADARAKADRAAREADKLYSDFVKEQEAHRTGLTQAGIKARTAAQNTANEQRKRSDASYTNWWVDQLKTRERAERDGTRAISSARTRERGIVSAVGGANLTFQNLSDKVGRTMGVGSPEEAAVTANLNRALSDYVKTVNQYGAASVEAARKSLAWKTAINDTKKAIDEANAAAAAGRRNAQAAAGPTPAQIAAGQRRIDTAQRASIASQNRNDNAVTTVANRALGLTNRIDRQVEDPRLQAELLNRVRVVSGEATRAIREYGAGSREATVMQNAFRMEARAVGDAITRHNGLFRQLRENTNTLNGSIHNLSGGFGGMRRMILNTQVALSALTAAFGVREILQTAQTLETVQNTLAAVSPSAQAAASNFQFLRAAGEAVGFSYLEAGRSFAQFTAASMAAGASTEQSQQAFLRLTMASRNLGLSAADTDGVIRAMTQSLSKGRFSAEEIRQQLGDRLPIAMAALERATGKSGEELDRMMRDGQITTSQFAVPFIEALLEMSGGLTATQRASLGLAASMGRLNNAWTDSVLGNPSLTNGLKTVIDALSKFLNSSFTNEMFVLMGKALSGVGTAMEAVVDIASQHLTPILMRLNQFLSGDLTTALNAVGGFLGGAFIVAMGAATAATIRFVAAWAMTPFGAATLAIGGLTAAFMVYKDELVTVGTDTARVIDIVVATYEYMKQGVTQAVTDIVATTKREFDGITAAVAAAAGWLGPIMYDALMKLAVINDAAADLFRALPSIVSAVVNDIGGYFRVLAANTVSWFRNSQLDIAAYIDALTAAVVGGFDALRRGDFANVGQAIGDSFISGLQIAEAQAQASYSPMQTYTATAGAAIQTYMQSAGSTAAQDFVTNFGTTLTSMSSTISGALSGAFSPAIAAIMQAASQRLAQEQANAAAMAGAAATTGANPPAPPGGVAGLLGPLAPGYGRTTPPSNRTAGRLRGGVQELIEDIERQAQLAGKDDGAATTLTRALNRLEDAAKSASGSIDVSAERGRVALAVYAQLVAEYDKFVRETDRATVANNRVAASWMHSAEAGEAAEIEMRAYEQAMKYTARTTDANGVATGAYLEWVNKLIPVLTAAEQAERNRAAARQIATNRDDLAVIELETRLIGQNTNAVQEEVAALRARQAARGAAPDVVDAAERSARQLTSARLNSEQLQNSWQDLARMGEQAFDRIGSAITEAFAQGKISSISFAKVGKAMISEVIQAALRLALINPMLNSVFGGTRGTMDGLFAVMNSPSFGGFGGTGGGAISAAGLAAAGGSAVMSGGGNGASSGGIFGGIGSALSSGWNTISGWLGGSTASAGMTYAASGLSSGALEGAGGLAALEASGVGAAPAAGAASGIGSALGGVAGGFMLGSAIGGMVAGDSKARQTNSMIGSGVGAVGGFLLGGPIGGLIGGAAGGALGGLIGPGKGFSGGDALVSLDDDGMLKVTQYAGKNFEQQAELMAQAKQQTDALNAQLKALGLSFTGRTKQGDFALALGGGESPNPTDIGGALSAFNFTGASLQADNQNVSTAINSRKKDGSNLSVTEAIEAANWVVATYEPLTDTTGAYAKTIKELNKTFDEALEKTKELGLSEADLAKAREKAITTAGEERDAQIITALYSVEARSRRVDGGILNNRDADLYEYTARAKAETLSYRKTLEDLSLSEAEVGEKMLRLAEVQEKEKASIVTKYETDIRNWITGTYNVLTKQTNGFEVSLAALGEQFDAASKIAKELGLSESALAEARREATEELYAARASQVASLRGSLTIRQLRTVGDDASNQTADLMEFDLSAVQERVAFKKGMFDLGMTSAEISAEMVRLEETLGMERLSIIKKYSDAIAQTEREKRESAQSDATGMLDGIRDYIRGLRTGDNSVLDAQAQYRLASSEFLSISEKASAGDANAMMKLTSYADTFINASRNLNGSGTTYVQDFDRVVAALEQVADQGPDTLTASFLARTTENQTTTLVESLQAVKEEITALRREVRQQATTPERVT